MGRRSALWLWLAVACGDPKAPPAESPASTSCPDTLSVVVEPVLVPGSMVVIAAEPAVEGSYRWEVEVGEVGAAAATSTWSLPRELAENLDEVRRVSVELDVPGCEPVSAQAEVTLRWPEGQRVVVLYDPQVAGSYDVALAYAEFREVPAEQLCAVTASDPTTIPAAELDSLLATVMGCVGEAGAHIHYLVPVYGVPYRINGRINDLYYQTPTITSLDALLVYGELAAELSEPTESRLYQEGQSLTGSYDPYVPVGSLFDSINRDYYLVARIDGADAAAAIRLIERTAAAEALLADAGALAGTVYVDGNQGDVPPSTDVFGSYESGEWNMWGTRYLFEADGRWPVVWDGDAAEFGTEPAPLTCPDALFYAGWYSFNHYNDVFEWNVGAVGGHLDSCSACDIRTGDAWAANALQQGITATFGAVYEPYVSGMPEYDQFFLYLLSGANFAEAGYEATRIGAWMQVFVGDPLYRPIPG